MFEGVDGLTVSGVSTDHKHFVVLGFVDQLIKSAAEVILAEIDRDAVCTYISGPHLRSPSMPGSPPGTWATSLN